MNTLANIDFNSLMDVVGFETRKVVHADRHDVQQDIFESLLKQLNENPNYATTEKQVGGLCRTIARRTVADYFRHLNTNKVKSTIYWDFREPGEEGDEEADPKAESFLLVGEDGYGLFNTMQDLHTNYRNHRHMFTPTERRVIEFKLTEEGLDMSWTEVSNAIGVHKSHASRAKDKFEAIALVG